MPIGVPVAAGTLALLALLALAYHCLKEVPFSSIPCLCPQPSLQNLFLLLMTTLCPGLEVQMEALLWRLEVPPNWREPAACLHSQARRGPAGNPLFRVPCPSVAFSNVPLKALMAPGLLLSFDMKRSPPRCFRAGCGIRQAPCIHMDGGNATVGGMRGGSLSQGSLA